MNGDASKPNNEKREERPRAVDLITDRNKGRIYTVGRLDEDTVGLVVLTSDGEFANKVMHPRYGVSKTYIVKVHGRIDDESLMRIREGVHLSEGRTGGARVVVQRRGARVSTLLVTLKIALPLLLTAVVIGLVPSDGAIPATANRAMSTNSVAYAWSQGL